MNRNKSLLVLATAVLGVTGAQAIQFTYIDWTSFNTTSAVGSITLPSTEVVNVNYSGQLISPTSTGGGFDYWNSPNVSATTYNSVMVTNRPATADILVITGENAAPLTKHTIKFSRKIDRIAMPIVSVGQAGLPVSYRFDQSFTIASQGQGHWGGNAASFTQSGNTLTGREAHGTIVFENTDTISFTASPFENWHGFTAGINSEPVPEPYTLGLGAAGLLAAARRRRARKS